MAIPNTTCYESLATPASVTRERHVDAEGPVQPDLPRNRPRPYEYGYSTTPEPYGERAA
jgi:hypothetical protein